MVQNCRLEIFNYQNQVIRPLLKFSSLCLSCQRILDTSLLFSQYCQGGVRCSRLATCNCRSGCRQCSYLDCSDRVALLRILLSYTRHPPPFSFYTSRPSALSYSTTMQPFQCGVPNAVCKSNDSQCICMMCQDPPAWSHSAGFSLAELLPRFVRRSMLTSTDRRVHHHGDTWQPPTLSLGMRRRSIPCFMNTFPAV